MRRRVLRLGVAAVAATVACLTTVACSLADLDALSAGAPSGEASEASVLEGGPGPEASALDAMVDAPDAFDPSAAYEAVVRADGPVAYYRFEDPFDANSAKDSVGTHVASATGQGVTFGKAGLRGSGATFDGADDATLDVGDAFDFAGQKAFTLEVWVRALTGTVTGQLVHKRDQSADPFKGYILYSDNDSTPHFEAWGVNMNAYSADVLGTTFTHVVSVVSYATGKGNAKMFVNGKPSATGGYDNVTDLADTPARLRFGVGFKGVLDEVALYDKALPADRILEHYRAGR